MKKSDPYELMKKSNPYEMMKKSKFSFLQMIREPGIHAPHAVGPTNKSGVVYTKKYWYDSGQGRIFLKLHDSAWARYFKFRDLNGPGPFSKILGP